MPVIALVSNRHIAEFSDVSGRLAASLSKGATVYVEEDIKDFFPNLPSLDNDKLFEKSDVIVSLGGDGTLLRHARTASKYGKCIVGVNTGHLGFLTAFDGCDIENIANMILNNRYKKKSRLMLRAEILRNGEKIEELDALNDIVIKRIGSRMQGIDCFLGNDRLGTYFADGLIISTPTGSTAYSLSAGGPIISPDTDVFAVTPICPHALSSRCVIVPSDKMISLFCDGESEVSADGNDSINIKTGDEVRLYRSPLTAYTAEGEDSDFFDAVRKKLTGERIK